MECVSKGLLIILSGPSGVGKGTVRQELFKDETLNLAYSISMTTRKPRPNEKEGVDYFFVSEKEFEDKIEKGELLEYARKKLRKLLKKMPRIRLYPFSIQRFFFMIK